MKIDKNPRQIEEMFDNIAYKYDKMNDLISFFMHLLVKKNAVKSMKITCYRVGFFFKYVENRKRKAS